jgi:Neuraminidase (sialidase)
MGIGVIPLVEPNGDLAMAWDDFGTGVDYEVSAVSKDGGRTWSAMTTIDRFEGSEVPNMRTGGLPSAAVDPRTGVLYVVWQDARFRSDGTNDIVMSRSPNEGRTWRPIVPVNSDPPDSGIDHFTPAVAAWGPNVHVSYRTRVVVNGQWSRYVDMVYQRSPDNGATWARAHRLGPPTDLHWAAQAHGRFLGDYMAIAAWRDVAHPVWCAAYRPDKREKRWHQVTWSSTVARK